MHKSFLTIPAVVLMAASAAAIAGGEFHHHHGFGMRHELRQLGLSDAQKTTVHQIMHANFEQNHAQREALFQQRMALESATPGTAAYQSAAATLAAAEGTAASARVEQRAAVGAQIYAVLTEAQKAQFATLQAEHQAKVAKWQAEHAEELGAKN